MLAPPLPLSSAKKPAPAIVAKTPWTRGLLLGISLGWMLLVTPVCVVRWGAPGVLPQIAIHLFLLYAILRPNNGWLGPVVTRFEPSAPGAREVWLTIDDGPDPADSPRLLDVLDAAGARATFFLRGDRARSCPTAVREIVRRGHTVGNHTDTHLSQWFWALGPRALAREIDSAETALAGALNDDGNDVTSARRCSFFRPPVGMQNMFLWPLLRARGMQLVGWSARGFDGVARSAPADSVARILRDVRPGAIVLLHEGVRARDGEALNVTGLELLLEALRARGYAAIIPRAEQLRW